MLELHFFETEIVLDPVEILPSPHTLPYRILSIQVRGVAENFDDAGPRPFGIGGVAI